MFAKLKFSPPVPILSKVPIMTPRPRKEIDTTTFSGRFAVRLRELREEKNLTVEELAEKSGVSKRTIFSWEAAERTPISEDVLKIADSLEVKIHSLIPEK